MKEIGESLKEAREEMGISFEEASEDLKQSIENIKQIEEGNVTYFKDIFYLKELIKDYTKYLGLDTEKMLDEFNEYLFDYTSKISLDDIKKAKKKRDNEDRKKEKGITSPYTADVKYFKLWHKLLIAFLVIVILFGFSYYFFFLNINTGGLYEFS